MPTPAFWPDGPSIGATAYTLRMQGDNRYETAASIAMVTTLNLNKTSGYPFEQVTLGINARGNDNVPTETYGLSTCPETIHIAAGDNPADALAASGVKGITNLPLGDTGVLTNVTNALVLLTDAARGNPGAVLNPRTRTALLTIRDNCQKPFNAVILGGEAAVSVTAAAEVDAIANAVARVDGSGLQASIEAATG
ncbi:MAG: cell wall-binding repeat-containing protein [Acidimicrobiales bacterium]|nr:cell wall-binding repeat-containing protein [Acidimicrobiales bacterium]